MFIYSLGDLPVDSMISDDMFTVKRVCDIPDTKDASSRADDLLHKVNTLLVRDVH